MMPTRPLCVQARYIVMFASGQGLHQIIFDELWLLLSAAILRRRTAVLLRQVNISRTLCFSCELFPIVSGPKRSLSQAALAWRGWISGAALALNFAPKLRARRPRLSYRCECS
jgi:hypothetical protein